MSNFLFNFFNFNTRLATAVVWLAVLSWGATAHASEWFVSGDAAAGKVLFEKSCPVCHGVAGEAPSLPLYPLLAGQSAGYLVKQMHDYKKGIRQNALMNGMMALIEEAQFSDIAAYLSSVPPPPPSGETPNAAGAKIYAEGIAARGLPSCSSCHGLSAEGIGQEFPRLAGQSADYIKAQLQQFRAGQRDSAIMNAAAKALDDNDIDALAAYLSAL